MVGCAAKRLSPLGPPLLPPLGDKIVDEVVEWLKKPTVATTVPDFTLNPKPSWEKGQ